MSQNQHESDDSFAATSKDIKDIVAVIAKAEGGIATHQTGIANLTKTLVAAYYRLGSLLMSLPGARGELRQARGAWLKMAVALCGNKDRVYLARDVADYFDDPLDSKVRASGKTGEERAMAFNKTLDEMEYLIRDKKCHEASIRKRGREQAEKAVNRQGAVAKEGSERHGKASRFL